MPEFVHCTLQQCTGKDKICKYLTNAFKQKAKVRTFFVFGCDSQFPFCALNPFDYRFIVY